MLVSDKSFNNIKIHTQYSICEGAARIDDLQEYSKKNKIKSLGLCDTSNLCGALEFAEKISKSGTQPIIGTQINFKIGETIGLLPLFALNEVGYKNIIELSSNKAFSIQNIVKLDGRLSAYPPNQGGYVPLNCYLLKEENGAFLLDTGYLYHQKNVLDQLKSLLGPDIPLSIIPLRINEFMSVGNVKAISQNFNVIGYYSPHPEGADWFDFTDEERDLSLKDIPTTIVRGMVNCEVGEGSGRHIDIMSAPIRLINTSWIYDKSTKILYSSDMFNYGIAETNSEEWIINSIDNEISSSFIKSFLLNTRYWWLEGAKTRLLREKSSS